MRHSPHDARCAERCQDRPPSRRHYHPGRRAALALLVPLLIAAGPAPAPVTPASGSSWLTVMKRSLDRTALGRAGTTGQAVAAEAPGPSLDLAAMLRQGLVVRGSDLFRYNCRACHGAAGAGLPPEIQPLTRGVRATSIVVQKRVLSAEGGSVETGEAEEMARLAEAALRHRLEEGGAAMPPFDHVGPRETEVLLAYLETLSRVPDPRHRDAPLDLPAVQVGEHVVKGTCQICHDATAKAAAWRPADRQIPPLSALPERYAIGSFVDKARHGDPISLGRGRMPQLPYLNDAEMQAAYLYLAAYPPQ